MPSIEKPIRLLFTCEHGGNRAPKKYRPLFAGAKEVLESHRGYDPGTLELGKLFARRFQATCFSSTITRLLVDLNRSPGHPRLFSEYSRGLAKAEREAILADYYFPHRTAVEQWIAAEISAGNRVLHIGLHSFTPSLNGSIRTADVGFLYDPARSWERDAASRWRGALFNLRPDLRIRRNYPYLGRSDGLVTHLRRLHGNDDYAGLELEVNQLWPQGEKIAWRTLQQNLLESLMAFARQVR